MPLTTEEKQELISEIGKGLAANFAEAIKPLSDKFDQLQANTEEKLKLLTANHDAEEARKREAVKKEFGEVVANSLQGDALDEVFKKLGNATPIAPNSATTQPESGAPAADEYFK